MYLKQIVVTWGIPESRVKVIYSVSSDVAPAFSGTHVTSETVLSEAPKLITAGRLVPWKGIATVIELLPQLQKTFPDVSLSIAGDGEERASLESRVQALGLEESVRFTGRLTQADLFAAIASSHVFVLNTAYEGLSHQLIEVMTIGTPIVSTNVGGNCELITDGVHGRLVPYNDVDALSIAITELLLHPTYAATLADAAKARVALFTREKMIAELVDTLTEVARSHTKAAVEQ
jgi:glycosyltransferase involved in cell wall biosynthesis